MSVSFFGRFLAVTRYALVLGVHTYTIGNPAGISGGRRETTISATFQVPSPGAALVLIMGGAGVLRRRR